MNDFKKVIRIGKIQRGFSTFCRIEFEDGRLSISGVEGPTPDGNARGSCGQIDMHEWPIIEYAPGWSAEKVAKFRAIWKEWHLNDMNAGCEHQTGPSWTPKDVNIYHFNLTRASSDVKRSAENAVIEALKKGETFTPTPEQSRIASLPYSITSHLAEAPKDYEPVRQTTYSRPVETKKTNGLREDEHPEGYLGKACPVCGHKYGTKWLKREVPEDVLEWLKALPNTDVQPAWV